MDGERHMKVTQNRAWDGDHPQGNATAIRDRFKKETMKMNTDYMALVEEQHSAATQVVSPFKWVESSNGEPVYLYPVASTSQDPNRRLQEIQQEKNKIIFDNYYNSWVEDSACGSTSFDKEVLIWHDDPDLEMEKENWQAPVLKSSTKLSNKSKGCRTILMDITPAVSTQELSELYVSRVLHI